MNIKELIQIVDNGDMITLYHGLSKDALEYVLTEGELTPRVCAEGGPKAVYFCEYPLQYPCVVAIDIPKSEIGRGSKRFEIYANKQYITLKPVKIDECNFRLIKWSPWDFESDDVDHLKSIWKGDNLRLLQAWNKHFDSYPMTREYIINEYLEKD